MNYVRLYITHDGTNTYMSEYYIDNNLSSSTGDPIGHLLVLIWAVEFFH